MCDTFHPLKLSRLAHELDDGIYWRSWYENATTRAESSDEPGDDAGLTSHL